MEKILITGVAGFIGSAVANKFLDEGYEVVGVDNLSTGHATSVPKGVEFINEDLALGSAIRRLPSDCTKILHLAGQSSGEISFDNPIVDLQKNTISTLNLIQYGIRNQVERIIYASSMSIYGAVPDTPIAEDFHAKPLSCYGVGKYASENYLKVYQSELPFIALRMFNVYGPGQDLRNLRQGMLSIYLAQALAGNKILVKGSVDRFRDFIYIDDVVEAWYRAAIYSDIRSPVLNVGTGIKTTVKNLLEKICLAIPGSSYVTQGGTPGDQSGIHADISLMGGCLDLVEFKPLDDGLIKFIEWARNHPI